MRPRVFPAEDGGRLGKHAAPEVASMRPRVFPAEDSTAPVRRSRGRSSFNEAAGIPRGRRQERCALDDRAHASMRPRVFPAEDQ